MQSKRYFQKVDNRPEGPVSAAIALTVRSSTVMLLLCQIWDGLFIYNGHEENKVGESQPQELSFCHL